MAVEIVFIGYRGIRGTAEIGGETILVNTCTFVLVHTEFILV